MADLIPAKRVLQSRTKKVSKVERLDAAMAE
jgi:hypothetical protein